MKHQVRRTRGTAPLCLLLALPACGDDDGGPSPVDSCEIGYLGEQGADIELEVLALGVSARSNPIGDGDPIDIITPPQGGRVVFVGVRARNLSACGVQLKGIIRDPETKRTMFDRRTINLKRAPDGWGTSVDSDISTFSNIGVCPNQWSARDVVDQDYEIEVQLMDKKGRSAAKSVMVRPACNEQEPELAAECRCICQPMRELGEACQ